MNEEGVVALETVTGDSSKSPLVTWRGGSHYDYSCVKPVFSTDKKNQERLRFI